MVDPKSRVGRRSAKDALALGPRSDGAFSPIDRALGDLLARHGAGDLDQRQTLARTGALLSHLRAGGHSCLDLARWAGRPLPASPGARDPDHEPPRLPALAVWRRALETSGLLVSATATDLAPESPPHPLVLDDGGRLYFWRYFRAERRLLENLRLRLESHPSTEGTPSTSPETRELFRRLFPPPDDPAVDWQAVAAAVALAHPLTLISGGPGTGKTTTVCRILALAAQVRPELRIALAAPTGKAAARLAESIASQVENLPLADAGSEASLRQRIPRQATTLHRLLGFHPERETFRHHPGRPLACDLLVVDEASMVDLLLMDAVVAALAPSAHLVLLGDRDQLTSVETGFVFADLCRAAARRPPSDTLRRHWLDLSGRPWPAEEQPALQPPPQKDDSAAPSLEQRLADRAVTLRFSFRFRNQPGIGALAEALRRGDGEGALEVLTDPGYEGVQLLPTPDRAADDFAIFEPVAEELNELVRSTDASEALERLGRFRILAPHRQGRWGVESLNRRVDAWLQDRAERSSDAGDPTLGEVPLAGRPLMIVRNDRRLGLFNGDVGICWPEAVRTANARPGLGVFFPGEEGIRRFSPGKLPPHETAWAMTVHKSQGSEFDRVLLVLGDQDSPLLGRELLYTAVTRARQAVTLVGEAELVLAAVARVTRRASGLPHLLGLVSSPELPPSDSPPTSPSDPPPTQATESREEPKEPKEPEEPVQLRLFDE